MPSPLPQVNYLSDESVTYLVAQRGAALRHLWIDGESLTDSSFSTFHKLQQLELLSVSFCDSMGAEGLRAISGLSRLEWLRLEGRSHRCKIFSFSVPDP